MPVQKPLSAMDLGVAVEHAVRNKEWVVVVYPDATIAHRDRMSLPAVLPPNTTGGGRTFRLPGGGRISIVCALDPVFIPKDNTFTVMFLGWEDSTPKGYTGMAAWQKRASGHIDLIKTRSVLRGA